jgi:hypothetical protein
MTTNTAILNRQGEALFNFMSIKHQNDKKIGELTVKDFLEMCEFLAELEVDDAAN